MMKMIFPFYSPKEHYHNKVAFLWCPDQRFEKLRQAFLKEKSFSLADPILIPGGAKVLARADNPRDKEFILEQIELLKNHGFGTLYIMAHNECAALAGNKSHLVYEVLLKRAAKVVRERIPDLEVIPIYADFTGLYEVE